MTIDVVVQAPPRIGSVAWDRLASAAAVDRAGLCLVDTSGMLSTGDSGLPVVNAVDTTYLGGVNLAAARSSATWILVLEGEYIVDAATVLHLLTRVSDAPTDRVFTLERRQAAGRGFAPLSHLYSPGGAILVPRATFLRLRGLNESVDFHAGTRDFVHRARLASIPVQELHGPEASAVRHPESYDPSVWGSVTPAEVKKMLDTVPQQSEIYVNLRSWSVPEDERVPLVSVAISTRDRSEYLRDALNSVLYQTFQDFEIIVVDDGSKDDRARSVVESMGDPRIRYVWQPAGGISLARNRAADESLGWFTAVHDDDDIMLPWRLEVGLNAMTRSVDAVYGSWANFDEESGDLKVFLTKKSFGTALNAFSGQGPGHGTWLLPTSLIRQYRYDEGLTSSVDHNLASRLAWHGVVWKHVEDLVYLRRVHAGQISRTEASVQKAGHVMTLFGDSLSSSVGDRASLHAAGKALHFPKLARGDDPFAAYGAWLPDNLVRRRVVVAGGVTNKLFEMDMPPNLNYILEERDALTGRLRVELAEITDVSVDDLVQFRRRGITDLVLRAELRGPDEESAAPEDLEPTPPFAQALARFEAASARHKLSGHWVLVRYDKDAPPSRILEDAAVAVRVAASAGAGGRIIIYGYFYNSFEAARAGLVTLREEQGAHVQILTTSRRAEIARHFSAFQEV